MPNGKSASPGWSTLLGMGASIAAALVAGLAVGWVVDRLAGTTPVFMIVGLFLGVVAAVYYVIVSFRTYLK